MPGYTKPSINNIPFSFSTDGYSSPNFGDVPFNFSYRPSYEQTSDLQSAINVMGLYQEETYTYTKECPTIVVGYSSTGVPQILQLPCIYGGIRDIGGSIYGNPTHADLAAYILAVSGQGNLSAYIKSTIQSSLNLGASTFGYLPIDLPAILSGWATKDLPATIYSTFLSSYIDLAAVLNVIEVRNLPASLLGVLFSGIKNITSSIFGYPPVDLSASITPLISWTAVNLSAYIKSIYFSDLGAVIQSFTMADLGAFAYSIPPIDLGGQLHGWDVSNLGVSLVGVYSPYDIQAYIYGVGGFKNLNSFIRGMIETQVAVDLSALLYGSNIYDMRASINSIIPTDLGAYLNSVGKSIDLPAYIVPKVIYLSKVFQVSLLEYKDMKAMINSSCFGTGYNDLYAYIRSIEKLDLRAVLYAWKQGISDNIRDLMSYINTSICTVEDRIPINFISHPLKYTQLIINFNLIVRPTYRVFDTINIFFGAPIFKNLNASIMGILPSVNLPALIIPVFQWNYRDLPLNVNPKTHQIVIDFNEKWREEFRRMVEIFFQYTGDGPYKYFYVQGADKVYRSDRDRHWTIWAKSYTEISDSMIERRNVRHKYIFKMSQYSTVDEAVRDIIDRVSFYRRVNLSATIFAISPPQKNLTASISPVFTTNRRWSKNLHVSITCA